jgi:hypothetical protein
MIGAEQTARARAIAEFSRFGDRFVRTAHSSTCGCGFAIARLHRVVRPESERKANGLLYGGGRMAAQREVTQKGPEGRAI